MLSRLQIQTINAIVNIFETGRALGDYGNVTVVAGDAGHLTYGRSQTTLPTGNLYLLIKQYCDAAGAQYASEFSAYLPRLKDKDLSLDYDQALHNILRQAGDDPVMRETQDDFFDQHYFRPSAAVCETLGIEEALGAAVVYDSHVHGSWQRICDRTTQNHGALADIGERTWITHYVNERRSWLANHSNALLQKTVYRMDAFKAIIADDNWTLDLPIKVRTILIDENSLTDAGSPTPPVNAQQTNRLLKLTTPNMTGEDVRAVQQALAAKGYPIGIDGVFGKETDRVVREFQSANNLEVDGKVGADTRALLL